MHCINDFVFRFQLHTGVIRDVTFLHSSWPWSNGQSALLTAGSDGIVKVSTLDGRVVHSYIVGHQINTICSTPEPYNLAAEDGFYSNWIFATIELCSLLTWVVNLRSVYYRCDNERRWNDFGLYTWCGSSGAPQRTERYAHLEVKVLNELNIVQLMNEVNAGKWHSSFLSGTPVTVPLYILDVRMVF